MISYPVRSDARVHIEGLIEEDIYLACSYEAGPDNKTIRVKDLHERPMIMPQEQHGVGQPISQAAKKLGFEIITTQVSDALHPTIQMVEAGFDNALLP